MMRPGLHQPPLWRLAPWWVLASAAVLLVYPFLIPIFPDASTPAKHLAHGLAWILRSGIAGAAAITGSWQVLRLLPQVVLREPLETPFLPAPPGTYACPQVRDSGSGIHPDELPNIFDPFFTNRPLHEAQEATARSR